MTAPRTGSPSSDLLSITTSRIDDRARVCVAGEVDCSSAPQLVDCIESLLVAAPAEVAVDLTRVTFLDSAGLHALVMSHSRAGHLGVPLRVLVGTRAVLRPLQVTGLWDVLAVEQVEPGAGTAA